MKDFLAAVTHSTVWLCLLSPAFLLHSQCPDTGESKVFQSNSGAGYYFYKFQGDDSFRYFLEGKTFSLNGKDNPGKTYLFIDDLIYEPLLLESSQLKEYTQSSDPTDILRAQAAYEQKYFKGIDPSMVIIDFGPAAMDNPDGSKGRIFYLWKKESPPGKQAATQYLVSTMVKNRLFVMSFMPSKGSISDNAMMPRIQSYTSHFAQLTAAECAQALGATAVH